MKQEKQEKYTLSPQIEQYFPRPRPAPPPRHGVRCRTTYSHPFRSLYLPTLGTWHIPEYNTADRTGLRQTSSGLLGRDT